MPVQFPEAFFPLTSIDLSAPFSILAIFFLSQEALKKHYVVPSDTSMQHLTNHPDVQINLFVQHQSVEPEWKIILEVPGVLPNMKTEKR